MEKKEECRNENLMGTMPVPMLIIKTSIPLIISLLVNNLYNLVDLSLIHISGSPTMWTGKRFLGPLM